MKWQQFKRWKKHQASGYDLFSIHLIPTAIVFLTLMIVIGFSWRTAVRDIEDTREETISQRARFTELTVDQRMKQYENILLAGAGYVRGSDFISRDEWHEFVKTLEVEKRFPGVVGMGYIEVISPDNLLAYEQRIRDEGFQSFSITPRRPARDLYSSVSYIEPFNTLNQRVFGYDMLTDPVRRAAMERARDSTTASMTTLIHLRQDVDAEQQPGLILYQPIYALNMPLETVEQRRTALKAYVYIPFRGEELFSSIFRDHEADFNLEIYDGTEIRDASLLYAQSAPDPSFQLIRTDEMKLYDQSWIFRYSARPDLVPQTIRNRPSSVAIGGTIFSVVVAAIVYLLLQRRTRILKHREEYRLQSAKDDMLSLASHQLRTPATGVKQYVGMLLEGFAGKLDSEQRDLLSRAYESNERQLRIINEFLYMAKADADRIVISRQKFDLVELTKDILDGMRNEITDARHRLKLAFPSKKMMITADPHSVRMIIENLVSNAIKYTPNGGSITVTLNRHGDTSFVAVSDNGVGIDKQNMKLLFRQFSRIPNELTKQTTGSGIGLYLARYLARKNGGDIIVDSTLGEGSTFTAIFSGKNVKNITARVKPALYNSPDVQTKNPGSRRRKSSQQRLPNNTRKNRPSGRSRL